MEEKKRSNGHRPPQVTTIMVAARNDELEATIRSLNIGIRVRVDRARTEREMLRLLDAKHQFPPEDDASGVRIVVLCDDLDTIKNGSDLVREPLALRPGLKVIWITDRLDGEREIEARRIGVYYMMQNPPDRSLLERVITKAVEHEIERLKTKA